MASTANASHGTCTVRCSVEKRSMCRDLQKWSKTLLCMIGLENVAERLVGRKKHLHRHGHHQTQPLQQHVLRISPFIEPLVLSRSSTQSRSGCSADSQQVASTSDTEAKASLPHDWDPKERCAICTQIAEKEELAKKAQATASSHSQPHSRSKKELRANADRTKEGSESKCANRVDSSASMATSSTHSSAGSGQQQSSKQQSHQVQPHLQHVIDWRSVNGGGGASGSSHPYGALNMFRSASAAGQSSSSSSFSSSGSLAASMFSPSGYPFFDLNQVYLNELLNHYSKVAAAVSGGTSTSSYGMMSPLSMGVSSMPPPPPLPYSVNASFSFPHLVATLGAQGTPASSSVPSLAPDEPLDLSKKALSTKRFGSAGHFASGSTALGDAGKVSSSSAAVNVAPSQSPVGSSGSKGPASNTSPNSSSSSGANKRTYSQADLQAAVDDIRSKKLGTRRASVVYGIPRSTLRNKIYKLEATDDDQPQSTPASLGASCTSSTKSSSRRADKSKTTSDGTAAIGEQKMDESPLVHDQGTPAADTVCGRMTTSSEDSSASLSSSSSSSSCANETNAFSYVDSYNGGWTTTAVGLTAELAKRQAVEALWRTTAANGAARSVFSNEIASFSSPIVNGSAAVKNVLQEAVCCALTENLKSKCASTSVHLDAVPSPISLVSKPSKSSSSGKRSSSSRRRGASSKTGANVERSPATMVKVDRPAQSTSTGGGSSTAEDANDPSKKIRPKRGQYRKYDKNALAEAVHAVRRGEMSVHRAGSYYGVPHSTLEYKVKERNLLRPKKRDLKKKIEDSGSGEASTAPATASAREEPSAAAKVPDPTTAEKIEGSAATKTKSSRATKSKRSKRPSQTAPSPLSTPQASSPTPSDIFSSLLPPASTPASLDLSTAAAEPSAKKRRKAAAAHASVPSSPSSSLALSSASTVKATEAAGQESATDKPQPSTESDGASDKGDYSTLKAYEAGFQAALLASDILHRLQMQSYSAPDESKATESDHDTPTQTQQGNELTAKTE